MAQALQWEVRVPTHWDLWMAAPAHLRDGVTESAEGFVERQIQLSSSGESTTFFLALLHDPAGVDIESEAEEQVRGQANGGPHGSVEIEAPVEVSQEGDRVVAEFRARGPDPNISREDVLEGTGAEERGWEWRFVLVQSSGREQEAWMLVCATSTSAARAECDDVIESFTPWEWPVAP